MADRYRGRCLACKLQRQEGKVRGEVGAGRCILDERGSASPCRVCLVSVVGQNLHVLFSWVMCLAMIHCHGIDKKRKVA